MKVYTVALGADNSPEVVSAEVTKETTLFYYIEPPTGLHRYAFGYGAANRVVKVRYETSARAALERFIAWRDQNRIAARAQANHYDEQITQAQTLLAQQTSEALS